MIEIFGHDISFTVDEDTEGVFVINGKGWEGEPFKLYLKEEHARDLIWQMSYFVSNPDSSRDSCSCYQAYEGAEWTICCYCQRNLGYD